MDVGRVELQGISNEFRLLILRERMADKGIQVAMVLKDHDYLVRQHKLSQLN